MRLAEQARIFTDDGIFAADSVRSGIASDKVSKILTLDGWADISFEDLGGSQDFVIVHTARFQKIELDPEARVQFIIDGGLKGWKKAGSVVEGDRLVCVRAWTSRSTRPFLADLRNLAYREDEVTKVETKNLSFVDLTADSLYIHGLLVKV